MSNNTEQIDRYLQNEMNAAERTAFEAQLAADKTLQEELAIHQQIIRAAETTGLKNEFAKAIRKKIFNKQLLGWGIVLITIVAAFIFYAVKTNLFNHTNKQTGEVVPEQFVINNASDTIIETKDGVVFAIPAGAFNGDNIRLEIKTALNPYDIMKNGLFTMSNGNLLQTGGMFYIKGYDNDREVPLVKDIAVSVPANEINPDMQLFDGVEDTNGHVNWVNPKPIEKKLRTYDITTLDFYPSDYIPTVKALQLNYQDKKYTDSLYYSFTSYSNENIPEINKTTDSTTTVALNKIQKNDYNPIDTSSRPDSNSSQPDYGEAMMHYEIDPARIRTIWNKKFNNTIIATKEFEERLRYMHTLCTSIYLDIYLQNLNKPMYEIDQLCADNSYGEIKKKFLEFAARKDGGVMIGEGIQQKLSNYFQRKYLAYKEASKKTWVKYEAELLKLNNIADAKRKEEGLKDLARKEKNFEEEFCINLTDAYRKIGITKNCNDTIVPAPTRYYNIIINTTGWKNLDAYVFEATGSRENMTYTDPITGKTATLTYKEASIQIENLESFDKALVYLIPDSLSSFQRVPKDGNYFKEKINSLLRYDAVVIAYRGTQSYFYRQNNLQPAAYTFQLTETNDKEIKRELQIYSRRLTKELRSEFDYQLFEQKEAIRQLQLRKGQQLREQLAAAIFKCKQDSENNYIPNESISEFDLPGPN